MTDIVRTEVSIVNPIPSVVGLGATLRLGEVPLSVAGGGCFEASGLSKKER